MISTLIFLQLKIEIPPHIVLLINCKNKMRIYSSYLWCVGVCEFEHKSALKEMTLIASYIYVQSFFLLWAKPFVGVIL